jgi:hypothetical protein
MSSYSVALLGGSETWEGASRRFGRARGYKVTFGLPDPQGETRLFLAALRAPSSRFHRAPQR